MKSSQGEKIIKRTSENIETFNNFLDDKPIGANMYGFRRIELMTLGVKLIKDNFFFGTGPGLTNYFNALESYNIHTHPGKAHNFYISYFAELGLIGFMLLLAMLISVFKLFKKNSNYIDKKGFRVLWLGLMIMLFFNEYITIPYIWMFLGIGTSCIYVNRQELVN
jgi:O-antigen ligase